MCRKTHIVFFTVERKQSRLIFYHNSLETIIQFPASKVGADFYSAKLLPQTLGLGSLSLKLLTKVSKPETSVVAFRSYLWDHERKDMGSRLIALLGNFGDKTVVTCILGGFFYTRFIPLSSLFLSHPPQRRG